MTNAHERAPLLTPPPPQKHLVKEVRKRSRSPLVSRSSTSSPANAASCDATEPQGAAAVQAVVDSLPAETRERLHQLVEDGVIHALDFDVQALGELRSLPHDLQDQVLTHLDAQKVFLMNSRSKNGFLVAMCGKARMGVLDARGFGNEDPWRPYLLAIATPRAPDIQLVPENVWLDRYGHEPARIIVDVSADQGVGVASVEVKFMLSRSVVFVKQRLATIGVNFPIHKMKLRMVPVGFLKDEKTLAFYNARSGTQLQLVYKTRGGVALKKDESAPCPRR